MNTTAIIAAILALLGGFAAGSAITTNDVPDTTQITNQVQERIMNENPRADDFVSLRPSITALPSETISEEERKGLLLMREEEKLARDVYQTLYDKWGLQIFANIAQSEQTHTEAVRNLLEKYDITDPVTDDTIGVFTDKTLQKLYTDLVAQGNESEVAALMVGATIEDLDIKDLQGLLVKTDNQNLTLVYENLMRGSRNHMRAFTKQLDMRGETYEPQYISEADYQTIINGSPESRMSDGKQGGTGGGMHDGRGWGGQGR